MSCWVQSRDVWDIQDALEGLATKEAVQMNSGTQNEVHNSCTSYYMYVYLCVQLHVCIPLCTAACMWMYHTVLVIEDLLPIYDVEVFVCVSGSGCTGYQLPFASEVKTQKTSTEVCWCDVHCLMVVMVMADIFVICAKSSR